MYTGSNIVRDGLIFGYDADDRSKRFYSGEPTVNISPYSDYSNRLYDTIYGPTGWGGDLANVYYYPDGGYNNLPYKRMYKYEMGTGGSYIDDNQSFHIENNKIYSISCYMKASHSTSLNGYAICINRPTTNTYRVGPTLNLTTEWVRYSWIYTSGVDHEGDYCSRHIIYTDVDLPVNIYWCGFQVEENSHPTQFTPTSRTATNSLIDLTGNSTIDLTNMSFDSTGHPVFNNNYINLPNDIGYTTEFSAFAFFKSLGTPGNNYHIVFGGGELELSIPTSGEIRTGIYTTTGRNCTNHGSGLTDGNYHQVGLTYNGTSKKSYIDGVEVGNTTCTGILINTFSNRRIGVYGSATNYYANGKIPIAKIYNKTLSQQEITQNFNAVRHRFGI